MADTLQTSSFLIDPARVKIAVGNTTEFKEKAPTDFTLTSPSYCTRIDYIAVIRAELAPANSSLNEDRDYLSKKMIDSIKLPVDTMQPSIFWSETCLGFSGQTQVTRLESIHDAIIARRTSIISTKYQSRFIIFGPA
ncbi:hypothetical protein [Burkholderia pyrrocinia]|uniref:hypothetical protein n=1 Tax=Burkholderia pyrrocinia TaxID=60550 RepID=UPI0011E4DC3B|nr:hypothetical protein [Burkholderia pyrrocinia]